MIAHIEAYRRHKNLKLAAAEYDLPWQSLYVILRKSGEPVIGDKSRYGSLKDKFSAKAEREFNRIVPFAISRNESQWQSKYDFEVLGLKVDVKASGLHRQSRKSDVRRWAFAFKKQTLVCDFICCFCYAESGEIQHIIIAPSEVFSGIQTVSVSSRGESKWLEYAIPEKDIPEFFKQIVEI